MSPTNGRDRSNPSPIWIMDGGLGTTLEDTFKRDISSPLWSARPIEHEPNVIIDAHLAFLRAGARIILTATYQCAFNTFERAGYTRDGAIRIMRTAVALAHTAKQQFLREAPETHAPENEGAEVKVGLALGAFGATISAREFDGFYPPPYGPRAYDASSPDGRSANCNAFSDDAAGRDDEEKAIEALKEFHLERLRVYAEHEETWRKVDWVAFETVPLRREARAIRRAMGELEGELRRRYGAREWWRKPWWVALVAPDGVFPEQAGQDPKGRTARVPFVDVVPALLGEDPSSPERASPRPTGIGINCTGLEHVGGIAEELRQSTENILAHNIEAPKPLLVLYPNGGDWDHSAKSWAKTCNGSGDDASTWAKNLQIIVRRQLQLGSKGGGESPWAGIIVGGCCKTGPREIAALAREAA